MGDPREELRSFPGMVRWFKPSLLIDTARQALASALFGQYADRRLIQAALGGQLDEKGREACNISPQTQDADKSVWVDFVADLGDGFDSTYAIAYLLSRRSLPLEADLPRGRVLLMGGDQVYPTATREEYKRRFTKPYALAFPNSKASTAAHPYLFLIPGNHDWYDGLVLFLAMFCRGRATSVGSWRATQNRSYFARRLTDQWWVWGIDTQLTDDIDAPQADYFVAVAQSMRPGDNVILCTGVPCWLDAESSGENEAGKEKFYRSLDYIAGIVKSQGKGARVRAVLSGDIHHYSRYSSDDGVQFITAGGGGAFLHPTHNLKDEFKAIWMGSQHTLSLKTDPADPAAPSGKPACYPPREDSRKLVLKNLGFVSKNPEFCLTLGGLFWIVSVFLALWRDDVIKDSPFATDASFALWSWSCSIAAAVAGSPLFTAVAAIFLVVFRTYTDEKVGHWRWAIGALHGAVHLLIVLAVMSLSVPLNFQLFGIAPGGYGSWVATALEMVLVGGFAGGAVWGLYLMITCGLFGMHANDAFSAMRLDCYRQFLRMRLTPDSLTIYPIGIDRSPSRGQWQPNPKAAAGNQDEPMYEPEPGALSPHLIEPPIRISCR
jgi:hypothetical protein